ncbi:class I SAM-dependent methyltransferase [Streptomyces tailanensis]|uniref:class I SAM-dependent methyltransferase n=1 Tax=Streptomyces tailanensis TaxID=2569858 RepID=UPI00122E5535|nr:SAM-dependent methyltransferase [Streptomyces tailanensis]
MEAISYTAQWTSAARAVETERLGDRLFADPYARELAAPRGFELLEKYDGGGLLPFLAIRTRFYDDTIASVLADTDIRQVVFVAAGMDTRVYRMDWPAGVVVYEADHAALLEEKHARLDRLNVTARAERREVAADLTTDWLSVLAEAGHDPDRRTLWVTEGLFFFLTLEQAGGLLDLLARASAPGSRLVTDMVNESMLRTPFNQDFLKALQSDGTPWLFGTDEPGKFLSERGWTAHQIAEPGEPAASAHRWPYEVRPRHRRGVPRSWLISAEYPPARATGPDGEK